MHDVFKVSNKSHLGNSRLVGTDTLRSLYLLLYHPGAHAQPLQHSRFLELSRFNIRCTSWTPHRPLRYHSDFRGPDQCGCVPTEADGLFWGIVNALGGKVFPLRSAKSFRGNNLFGTAINYRDLCDVQSDRTTRFCTCGRGDGVVCLELSATFHAGDAASCVRIIHVPRSSLVYGLDLG